MSVVSVKVRGNAPNWPAMCQQVNVKKKVTDGAAKKQMDYIKSASSSIWFESKSKIEQSTQGGDAKKYNLKTAKSSEAKALPKNRKSFDDTMQPNKWANSNLYAKNKVVRQCPKCQVLYDDAQHTCADL